MINQTKCIQGRVKCKDVVEKAKLSNNEVVAPVEEEEVSFRNITIGLCLILVWYGAGMWHKGLMTLS